MKGVTFIYEDWRGKHEIAMTKSAPEWCNSDCPDIYSKSDNPKLNGWRVNSGGLYAESMPEEMAELFGAFVLKSSQAYYRKYRPLEGHNGFWENFLRNNRRVHPNWYFKHLIKFANKD